MQLYDNDIHLMLSIVNLLIDLLIEKSNASANNLYVFFFFKEFFTRTNTWKITRNHDTKEKKKNEDKT